MAIGEGDVAVTPLQLALAYAALGNGGTLYQPQVVRAVETSDGAVVQEFPPRIRRQIQLAPESLRLVTAALHDVVNDPGGTAFASHDPSLDVAGKTGTAQTGYQAKKDEDPKMGWFLSQNHAWFASLAPGALARRWRSRSWSSTAARAPEIAVPVSMQVVREYERLQAIRLGHTASAKSPPAKPSKASPQPGGRP